MWYRFREVLDGTQSAYVVPHERLNAAAFPERLVARHPGLNKTQAKLYLKTLFEELAAVSREGDFVTLGGLASFGTATVGNVPPGETCLNATHELRAWVRFAPRLSRRCQSRRTHPAHHFPHPHRTTHHPRPSLNWLIGSLADWPYTTGLPPHAPAHQSADLGAFDIMTSSAEERWSVCPDGKVETRHDYGCNQE